MFGKRITLFTIFGFTVRLDLSWILLAILVASSMSSGFQAPPDAFPVTVAWIMGAAMAVGLFVSIVAHELTHSLVGRMHGMRMKGITLFFLGGVAEMEDEPATPWAEFAMAIVGPLASVVIAVLLAGVWYLGQALGWPLAFITVVQTLAVMNAVLAVFNMVPAFPLDGGRVLRSILWGLKGNLLWATRIASILGVGFGVVLIGAGVVLIAWQRQWQALTWVFIGFFLLRAARVPYQQLLVRQSLDGQPVRRFLEAEPIVVPRWIPLSEFVQDFVYRHRARVFPVVDHAGLTGIISADSLRSVPQEEWPTRSVGELTVPMPIERMIGADESAGVALERMARGGLPQLFVIEDGRLEGVVRFAAIAEFLQLRRELEGK